MDSSQSEGLREIGGFLHYCGEYMAREFAKQFYSSKAWQDTRNAYAASRLHLCERCLAKGIYTPGEIVHHKNRITPENINNPSITLSFDNLELLCRDCHAVEHSTGGKMGYQFDKYGNIIKTGGRRHGND